MHMLTSRPKVCVECFGVREEWIKVHSKTSTLDKFIINRKLSEINLRSYDLFPLPQIQLERTATYTRYIKLNDFTVFLIKDTNVYKLCSIYFGPT